MAGRPLHERTIAELSAQIHSGALSPVELTEHLLARIERYLEQAYASLITKETRDGVICGCPFGNLSLEMGTQDETIRRKLDQIFRGWAGYVEAAIQEAVEAGDLPEIDPHTSAEALVAFISGIAVLAKTRNSAAVARRLGPIAMQLIRSAKQLQ